MLVCQTDRLRIRRLVASDEHAMYRVYSDPEAMRYVDDGRPISREDCARWMLVTAENYGKRGYGMFAVELLRTTEVIGFCGLVHPGGQPEPEVKYAFQRTFWGQGFATETCRALITWGRESAELEEIIATVDPENKPSHAVLRKVGMRKLRTDMRSGRPVDVYST